MVGSTESATTYYVAQEQRGEMLVPREVPLVKQPDLLALKFKPGRVEPSPETLALLQRRATPVTFLPNYGIKVYSMTERDVAIPQLMRDPAIEFATPVFRQTPENPDPMIIGRHFVAQFKPEVTRQEIDALNARHKVQIASKLDYLPNAYMLETPPDPEGMSAVALANAYAKSGLVIFAEPDFIRYLRTRAETSGVQPPPRGPVSARPETRMLAAERAERPQVAPEQWHLPLAKVTDAWSITKGNPSIRVAIMDDGVDVGHPEFQAKVVDQYDFAGNVPDATPKAVDDSHGTACTGVATAAGVQASGAAPGCSLLAIRTPRFNASSDMARMFIWAADHGADVISCSWGPIDGRGSWDPLPAVIRSAINEVVKSGGRGRGGKGIPIFWAAGNGSESVSLDGYASNPDVIAVAASTSKDTHSWYSDFGPEVWICAPSSGDAAQGERGVFTTDRVGSAGYNPGNPAEGDPQGNYTNSFGGTSSATPLAAGVAALMLSANSNLTQPQVKEILKSTADKIGSGYDASGHNDEFGYGRINALKAVQAAQGRPTQPIPGGTASISGPASTARGGGPPTFQITLGANPYYAVEVTTQPELFDTTNHGAERNTSNFFGSWRQLPFLSSPSYTLPADAWENLRVANRLYYRLWTTTDAQHWLNWTVSVLDDQGASAPFIEVTGATMPAGPSIRGPSSAPRSGAPPTFQVSTGDNRYYAVEVATQPDLFDTTRHGAERNANNFFGSWRSLPFLSSPTYALPSDAWEKLCAADRLYYRLWTTARDREWVNWKVTVLDDQGASAPSIQLTGAGRVIGGGERAAPAGPAVMPPDIVGPDMWERGAGAPTFHVEPGSGRFFAVEVTTDWTLFDRDTNAEWRDPSDFYGSYQREGLRKAEGPTTYTLPQEVWERLKHAELLYYRVVTTSAEQPDWPGYDTSTPDALASHAPVMRIVQAQPAVARTRIPPAREAASEEESLWRSRMGRPAGAPGAAKR